MRRLHPSNEVPRRVAADTIEQVGKRVARFFLRAPSLRSAMRIARRSWTRRGGPATTLSESEFLERLKLVIEQNAGSAQAGRINIVGLGRLKEKLGERWDELRDRVQSIARSAIQKYLQPDDIWVPSGDCFVIAFGSVGFAEAQTKCRMIARLIEISLLGDASTDTISVATAVTTIDGRVVFRDLPSLETMIAGTGSFIQAGPGFREPADAKPALTVSVPTSSSDVSKPLGMIVNHRGVSVATRIAWEPIWDTRLQRITIYRARYVDHTPRTAEARPSEEDTGQIDFAVRDAVVQELAACVGEARMVALGLPVRFSTVASWGRRREYVAGLRERISPELRNLCLIYLSEVPDGVPETRLAELVAALRPFCRDLIVEGSLQMPDFPALASARVFAVAVDLDNSRMSEPVLLLKLERFAHHARKAGIANCYLGGARSMSLVTGAVGAGFRYISGHRIGRTAEEVSDSHPLTLEQLYANFDPAIVATKAPKTGSKGRRTITIRDSRAISSAITRSSLAKLDCLCSIAICFIRAPDSGKNAGTSSLAGNRASERAGLSALCPKVQHHTGKPHQSQSGRVPKDLGTVPRSVTSPFGLPRN